MAQFELIKQKFPIYTTMHVHLCSSLKSYTENSKAQCVGAPTTSILLTKAATLHDLNCVNHMIYISQTNITKILQNFWLTLIYNLPALPLDKTGDAMIICPQTNMPFFLHNKWSFILCLSESGYSWQFM